MFRISRPKKHIGFDLNGVIIDHTQRTVELAGSLGFVLSPRDTHPTCIARALPPEALAHIVDSLYNDKRIARTLPVMVGAYEVIASLHKKGIPFSIITRHKNTDDNALYLLQNHKLWPRYFNETNVFFVETKEDKDRVIREQGITHYIDNRPDVLDTISAPVQTILFDHLHAFTDSAYDTVSSWHDLKIRLTPTVGRGKFDI